MPKEHADPPHARRSTRPMPPRGSRSCSPTPSRRTRSGRRRRCRRPSPRESSWSAEEVPEGMSGSPSRPCSSATTRWQRMASRSCCSADRSAYSVAVGTGWRTLGARGTVTSAQGGQLDRIDDRPASEFLAPYLDVTGPAAFGNPLAVVEADTDRSYLRAIVGVRPGDRDRPGPWRRPGRGDRPARRRQGRRTSWPARVTPLSERVTGSRATPGRKPPSSSRA